MTEQSSSRRNFLTWLGLGGAAATVLASLGATMRYLMPAVFYEPSLRNKIGTPDEFAEGTSKLVRDAKVFVHNTPDGIFAISAVCTHLGCVVSQEDNGFSCPCHGSKFDQDGEVEAGPAPRALPWFEVTLSPEGQLVVDRSRAVERGTKLVV